jgi:hypothetical protein
MQCFCNKFPEENAKCDYTALFQNGLPSVSTPRNTHLSLMFTYIMTLHDSPMFQANNICSTAIYPEKLVLATVSLLEPSQDRKRQQQKM